MKILSPISKKEEVIPLIEAGADELYCGIVPIDWENRYSIFDILNRREGHRANFSKFEDLQYAIQLAHSRKVPIFVTMNGLYSREQYPLIYKIIEKLNDVKADGLIVADMGLLLALQEKDLFKEIHMGTGGTTFNSRTALFYKKLGASRIVLDRLLTINEISDIAKQTSSAVDLEVFILNTQCPNIDGFCTFYHGISLERENIIAKVERKNAKIEYFNSYDINYKGHGCILKYSMRVYDSYSKRLQRKPHPICKNKFQVKQSQKRCGACAIFDFNKLKINCLKIVERLFPTESKIRDTKFIRQALNVLAEENNISREQFIKKVQQLYCRTYGYNNCDGFSCYYPSVFNKTLDK